MVEAEERDTCLQMKKQAGDVDLKKRTRDFSREMSTQIVGEKPWWIEAGLVLDCSYEYMHTISYPSAGLGLRCDAIRSVRLPHHMRDSEGLAPLSRFRRLVALEDLSLLARCRKPVCDEVNYRLAASFISSASKSSFQSKEP